jgi:putative endonuclease
VTEAFRSRGPERGPPALPGERKYYVYILSTPARRLFVGVTNDPLRTLCEYGVNAPGRSPSILGAARLVYFEVSFDLRRAFARKEQLMGWNRRRRWRLIERINPTWENLAPLLRQ